jgi:hypothetical protein
MPLGLGVALALVLSAAPAPAQAPEVARAAKAFDAGQKLYRQGKYSEALAKFEEAYEAKPHPSIRYNIGKCYERLGDLPKAMRNYRDYLRLAPDAKDKDQVVSAVANLERRFREQGVQQLLVYSDPEGALVAVDDKELGKAPVSTELVPGDHHVALTLEGFESARRVFVMPPNRSIELSFALKPVAAPAPTPVLIPRPEPAFSPPPVASMPFEAVKPASPPSRKLTWVATGVFGAGAVTGIALGLGSAGATKQLRSQVHSGADAQGLVDRADGLATGANVAYTCAATAGVAAIVLYFLEPKLGNP